MLDAMSRRDTVTLQAECIPRLAQQPFVGTTVRLVAFGTPAALDGKRNGGRMRIHVRPALLRVAGVAIGRRAMAVLRFVSSGERMATQTVYRTVGKGVTGAAAERRADDNVAAAAKLRLVVG